MANSINVYLLGQTPLPATWQKDLIPSISTMGELNEFEARNIQLALQKYFYGRRKKWPVTDFQFLKRLHQEMFGEVWTWAGELRLASQETNIGVDAGKISVALSEAYKNCATWMEFKSYDPAEIAVRYHHKVVSVHPFPNGNGRFSRILADLTMSAMGLEALAWSGDDLANETEVREQYIAALKEADDGKFSKLLKFAKGSRGK